MAVRCTLGAALLATAALVGGPVVPSAAATVPSAAAATPVPSAAATDAAAAPDVEVVEVDVVVPTLDEVVAHAPAGDSTAAPAPAEEVAAVADDALGAGRVAADPVVATDAQTVGVTWPEGTPGTELAPEVRTLADGEWSAWTAMPVSDEAPDPGTEEAARTTRGGTDPVWIGDVDAVQVSFVAQEGADGAQEVELALVGSDLVEPVEDPTASGGRYGSRTVTEAAVGEPRVYSRAEWGAAPQSCTPDVATGLVGAVVHHTAGSNSYSTVAQAMQQLRNDQAYHMGTRGWCDLGYNAVVDKWGNIYEGRANSLAQPVIGVHAGGFNTGTFGVAMLGTYAAAPSAETQRSVGLVIGRRLALYGADPQGTVAYTTGAGENSRFLNQTVTLPRIFGHRDVAYTACPGDGGYAALATIRAVAASTASQLAVDDAISVVKAVYEDMLERAPEDAGLYGWAAQIVSGQPASRVAAGVASSREYVLTQVYEAYAEILGRTPDPSGIETWTTEIMSGRLRTEDLRGQLIASEEYFNAAGRDGPRWVASLYQDVLGRTPRPDEVSYWLGQVATKGRAVAPTGVWWSLESGYLRVEENYHQLLDRGSDPTGLRMWGPYWLAHGESALRAGIVESEEYRLRARARFP